jgi:hypothetical protein
MLNLIQHLALHRWSISFRFLPAPDTSYIYSPVLDKEADHHHCTLQFILHVT